MGMVPAAHAVENSADAGVVVPDEPDDEAFNPGVTSPVDENQDARAVFQAWKRLDTGLTATLGVSVPSRQPLEKMSLSSSYGMRVRSEEHTSELQSLMRISYAVFSLQTNNTPRRNQTAATPH